MKIKILDQTHPDYDAEYLERLYALYEGKERWQALIDYWLPRAPNETDANYTARKKFAVYVNYPASIIDLLAAAVFTDAPQITDWNEQPWTKVFLEDADGQGNSLHAWLTEWLVTALIGRCAYAWVNKPARPDGYAGSRADEERDGYLNVFLVPLSALQVIDWQLDAKGNPAWLMIRGKEHRRPTLDSERKCYHVWTYIDAVQIRRWEWSPKEGAETEEPSPEDDADELPPVAHGYGEIPVARLELTDGLHAMGKLHDPAVAYIRAANDLKWALHVAAHALLCIESKWGDQKPVLGPGQYMQLAQGDDAYYVEPAGSNFALLAEDKEKAREDLFRVVHQMAVGADSNATRSLMSGESKTADWRAMDVVLSALAERIRGAIREMLRLVTKARGKEEIPTVSGLDGWQQEDLDTWLSAAKEAVDAHSLSPTFRREMAKREAQRLLPDLGAEAMEKIEQEIDAAKVDMEQLPDGSKPPPPKPPAGPGGPPRK